MRLTDLSIKSLKLPAKGVVVYSDDALTGFGVRVSEGGTKSFVLTHGPRRQRETIGKVGILGLQEARTEAKRRLAEYTLGKAAPRSISWAAALSEYLEEVGRTRRPRTLKDYKRLLDKHFRFGKSNLNDLSPADFDKKLSK